MTTTGESINIEGMFCLLSSTVTTPMLNTGARAACRLQQQTTTRMSVSQTPSQLSTNRPSTQAVQDHWRVSQIAIRSSSTTGIENAGRTCDVVTDKILSKEASTDYSSEKFRTTLKSLPHSLKKWVQEQEASAKLVATQVVSQYKRALTDVVDHLYVPSDEAVPFIQGNFAPVREIGEKVRVELVEGQVPKDFPPGCFVRNGPNPRFGAQQNLDSPLFGGKTFYSWFEGEGMLHATYFEDDGSIWYKNKYVETESFSLETEMGRSIFLPTMDEHSSPGARFNRLLNAMRFGLPHRNTGNTSIFEHAGHTVATAEGGKPFEIDISDLSTKGEYCCNKNWNRRYFGPHPKVHPDTNQMVVYGFDIVKPYYVIEVISADGKQSMNKIDLGLDRLVLMHDIGITEDHIIVFDFPVVMDIFSMILKGESIVALDSKPYSRIGVIPLMGNKKSIKWFDVDSACISHHCNSYQEGDEIVVHAVVTHNLLLMSVPTKFDKLEWYSRGMTLDHQNSYEVKHPSVDGMLYERLYEWRLNLRTGGVVERDISDKKFPLELPRINEKFCGKKYQYIYACSEDIEASKGVGYPVYGNLVKVDVSQSGEQLVQFYDVGENTFTSEPVFVARPGSTQEDDGWIVTYVHNQLTNRSEMIIIDAQKFDKPLARLRLPQRVPYGFHGTYIVRNG